MFRRRVPPGLLATLRSWVWPASGWRRAGLYVAHRVRRLSGTPHSIAAGFASGVAVSFTPFVGFHILLACLICLPLRGNYLAAAVGTAAGNPWTFPFIWLWIYGLGRWLLGDDPTGGLREPTIAVIFDRPVTVLWPMVVGSLPTAVVAWVLAYVPLVRVIAAYHDARRRHRERRRAELLRRVRKGDGAKAGAATGRWRNRGGTAA